MSNAERETFMKVKALSKVIDLLIANAYDESENEILILSEMLNDYCEQLDKAD